MVGIGNSAVDIAVDLCRHANSVTLSSRRTAYIMPKYLLGIPTDRWSAFFARKLRLPTRVTRTIMAQLIKLTVGNQERFGIARPKHPIWREHATISQELLPYLGHGWITIKPNIRELRGKEVVFDDVSTRAIDAIIYATGYKTTFPFLDPAMFAVKDNDARLYRRMAPPEQPGLYFIGLGAADRPDDSARRDSGALARRRHLRRDQAAGPQPRWTPRLRSTTPRSPRPTSVRRATRWRSTSRIIRRSC